MNKITILLIIIIINIQPIISNEINVFFDLQNCISCEGAALVNISKQSKSKNHKFSIIISDIRESQFEYTYKKIAKEFKDINILIDTNNRLKNKYKIEKYPSICYIENENIIFKDNSLIYTNIFKFMDFQLKNIYLNEKLTPLFNPSLMINWNDTTYILDKFTKNIIVYNNKFEQIRKYNYDFLKYSLITGDTSKINPNYLKVSQSHFKLLDKSPYLFAKLPYLKSVSAERKDNIPRYRASLININTLKIEPLFLDKQISFYGYYSDRIDNGYFFETYQNIYHHSMHEELKDSTTIFSIFYKNRLEKIFSIADVESYTNTKFTYGYPSKHVKMDDKNIYILNEYFNLFGLINLDVKNKDYKINVFKPKGILKEAMEYLSKSDAFALLDHKPSLLEDIYSVVGVIQTDNKFGIYITKKVDKEYKALYFQQYDSTGKFLVEKKVELFNKINDKIKSILMIRNSNTKTNTTSFILKYIQSGYYKFTPFN